MKTDLEKLEEEVISCRRCERLVAWREEVARTKRRAYADQDYWGKPVPGFGDPQARILVIGLAPGAHGSNRTGRMFTGDASGDFLYPALYKSGFASQPTAQSRQDDLELKDLFITAVGRCAPPVNKPTNGELQNCRPFLLAEMDLLKNLQGIVALGKIALDQLLNIFKEQGHPESKFKFAHLAYLPSTGNFPWVLASYHPSRQNTQTGRLTEEMFALVWEMAKSKLC